MKTVCSRILMSSAAAALVLSASGCTGMGESVQREGTISVVFNRGAPNSPVARSDVLESQACVVIHRTRDIRTLRLTISARDPNGIASISVVTGREIFDSWKPPVRVISSTPRAHLEEGDRHYYRAGSFQNLIAFDDPPPDGEVQLTAVAIVEIDVTDDDITRETGQIWLGLGYEDSAGEYTSAGSMPLFWATELQGTWVCRNGRGTSDPLCGVPPGSEVCPSGRSR